MASPIIEPDDQGLAREGGNLLAIKDQTDKLTFSGSELLVDGSGSIQPIIGTVSAKLQDGSGNTRLRLTSQAGTATPLINSFFRVRRMSGANVGTFVA